MIIIFEFPNGKSHPGGMKYVNRGVQKNVNDHT